MSNKLVNWINERLQQIKNPNFLFGGVSVLVVGDFNQLAPLKENWAFEKLKTNPYKNLVESSVWESFEFFELTEIMRQKNDVFFAEALNKLGEDGVIGLSEEQINLFDSRIVRDLNDIPHDAVLLFHSNKEVAKYNMEKIINAKGDLVINEAIDYAVGQDKDLKCAINCANNCKNIDKLDETCGLPYKLMLKVNCKYMITTNQKVSDGIVNGAVGVLKKIILSQNQTDNKPHVKRC